ncbi:MAG: glycosyltransferase family 1 protein [Candidatus Electrothrix sp. ATG1]|nr:glycosyltransferase family 1 protein [Candidatus Electrothrix sp. ATG1]
MDGLICGNSWLANHFSSCNVPTWILPTGIDTQRWKPSPFTSQEYLYIGWIGTSGNYKYLYDIENVFLYLFEKFPFVKLLVVADTPPFFTRLPAQNVCFLRWSREVEVQAIQQMHIGIMPLHDNEWEKGKCSFKMLQYMATELPVVVSPVGMNKEVLERGEIGFGTRNYSEWIDALTSLVGSTELRRQMGEKGRNVVEQHYSVEKIIPQLVDVFEFFT